MLSFLTALRHHVDKTYEASRLDAQPSGPLVQASNNQGKISMIEMDFFELRLDESGADQIVILKEKDGDRMMPILIGYYEAQSIHLALNDIHIQRPLTHDLAASIVQALGASIDRIVVTDLRDSTFYARIYFSTPSGSADVDSRPSDAIALAVRASAPIFVAREVLDQVAHQ